ncbi:MAG: hypothetical protein ACREJR_04210 [Candidatus Rokuibacteriota bacterium]
MGETPIRLAGVHEIAEMLAIGAELVEELPASEALLRARTPFPRPLDTLIDHGPVWDRADVEAWRAARREAWRQAPAGRTP